MNPTFETPDYDLKVPGYDYHKGRRVTHTVAVKPIYELLEHELMTSKSAGKEIGGGGEDLGEDPRVFHENPTVKKCSPQERKELIQAALYLDGVAYSGRRQNPDGVLGFWIVNLKTKMRHLTCALRKSDMCQCGCGGWCSIFIVWYYIRWCLEALAEKTYPHTRLGGADWGDDFARKAVAGKDMMVRAVLLFVEALFPLTYFWRRAVAIGLWIFLTLRCTSGLEGAPGMGVYLHTTTVPLDF